MMKARWLSSVLGVASLVAMGALGVASAADEWFVMGEKTVKSADPSVEITAEDGKWFKEDIKKTKISVEGADVDITWVVLKWNNRPDETIRGVGIVKAGGQTAPADAPGREATLLSAMVQYKILNDAPTAHIKLWGYD